MTETKLKTQSLAANASTNITVKASAYLSSDQSINSAIYDTIELDTENYDVGGNFNTGTYQFTCPIDGFYLVTAALLFSAPVDQKRYELSIAIGGSRWASMLTNSSGTVNVSCFVSQIFDLSATQTIELVGWHDSGVAKNARGLFSYTYMTVHLLSV